MDLKKIAVEILKLKNLELSEDNIKTVMKDLQNRENKRYNAVCLGIDGTIENINEISDETLTAFCNLLNKHIPIVFITGRGETGFKKFFNNISKKLIEEKGLNKNLIKNIIGVTNDGEFLFYTSDVENSKDEITLMDKCLMLANDSDLLQVKEVRNQLSNFLDTKLININFSDSNCQSLRRDLVSFRIIIEDENNIEKMREFISYFIKLQKQKHPDSKINYTIGKFKGNSVFQIGVGNKSEAIEEIEKFLGIPRNSMIRIGDQGDSLGNDFSMLNSEQGYSVDTYSDNINTCYPVFNKNGNLLRGVNATTYLLNTAKIYPTVCLKNPNRERYTRQLALSEKIINQNKKGIIDNYDSKINNRFQICEGFNKVFDRKSGAITFEDWEWNLTDDTNELKQLFSQKENGGYKYCLDTDSTKLLRGAETYYYFLANRTNDITDDKLIMTWYLNHMDFFKKASLIVKNYKVKEYPYDLKLFLGLLDNMRNVALINLNTAIVSTFSDNKNVLLSLDSYNKHDDIKEWFDICNDIYQQITQLCFYDDKSKEIDTQSTYKTLNLMINKYPQIINKVLSEKNLDLNNRCYRTYREIDNFMENYITIKSTIDDLKKEDKGFLNQPINFIGLLYGGLELPLLAREIIKAEHGNVDASAFIVRKKNYNEMHSDNFFQNLIKQKIDIIGERDYHRGINIVTDDNVLTGVTMQAALELLFESEIYVDNLSVVRYPSINRVAHMFSNNRGAIDTSKFTTYIKGLIFPSPYTKIRDGKQMVDELGVFNKSRDRIVRFLYKNGLFARNGEVDLYVNKDKAKDER